MGDKNYTVRRFPATRAGIVATTRRARSKNIIHSLVEFDVTDARKHVKESRNGQQLSFKAWLIKCIASAAAQFPQVHSMRRGKKQYFFDTVDVAVIFEKEVEGEAMAVPAVIQKADIKTAEEITAEINNYKTTTADRNNMVLGKRRTSWITSLFLKLPEFLQTWVFNMLLGRPDIAHRMMGSIMVTNLSPFSGLNAWGIPLSMHPLTVLPGPITKKPVVYKDEIVVRSIMHCTLCFDHDVIDGAQIARFMKVLAQLIETPTSF